MSPVQDLVKIANRLRGDVLEMVVAAGSGHVAGPLSSADLFALLYFENVVDFSRDKVVLSCGHYCPILYAALARSGNFPVSELKTFMRASGRLPGHPERGSVPGVEVSAGPLGQGVSVAVGMALALKMRHGHQAPRVYCILSDGELQEGQVWEAFTLAVTKRLDNLIFILDRNKIQIEHYIREIVKSDEVGRFEAFGLHTLVVNGHNIEQLQQTITAAKHVVGGPVVVVMNTVAGKGVSFMEDSPAWHDKVPTKQQLEAALQEMDVQH
jgi:transketolase